MHPKEQVTGIGIYLVGHGPYRSPRPIELQFMRIRRYRGLLALRCRSWPPPKEHVFVDINYPRVEGSIDQDAFPSFFQLMAAVQACKINLVFFDVEEQVGFKHDYSWIRYFLEKQGAQPVNVFYDPDKALEDFLAERFEGQAFVHDITDASDFVAFYPALSAKISLAALRSVHQHSAFGNDRSAEKIWSTLYDFKDQKPYARGEEPFFQEDLVQEWYARTQEKLRQQWTERRKHETLFQLGPSLPGLLLDESIYGSRLQTRNQAELTWAENRVLSDLSFEKIIDGQIVSYVRNFSGYKVFAEIRIEEKISFYLYKSGGTIDRTLPNQLTFDLHDRYTRDLQRRWRAEFEKVVPRDTDHL